MQPTRLIESAYAYTRYYHEATHDETPETVMGRSYWAHVAEQLKAGDEIIVMKEDGSWRLHLLVRAAMPRDALVCVLSLHEFDAKENVEPEVVGYEIKWRSPTRKFGVIRISDGDVLRDEFQTRGDAASWLRSHMKAA